MKFHPTQDVSEVVRTLVDIHLGAGCSELTKVERATRFNKSAARITSPYSSGAHGTIRVAPESFLFG